MRHESTTSKITWTILLSAAAIVVGIRGYCIAAESVDLHQRVTAKEEQIREQAAEKRAPLLHAVARLRYQLALKKQELKSAESNLRAFDHKVTQRIRKETNELWIAAGKPAPFLEQNNVFLERRLVESLKERREKQEAERATLLESNKTARQTADDQISKLVECGFLQEAKLEHEKPASKIKIRSRSMSAPVEADSITFCYQVKIDGTARKGHIQVFKAPDGFWLPTSQTNEFGIIFVPAHSHSQE